MSSNGRDDRKVRMTMLTSASYEPDYVLSSCCFTVAAYSGAAISTHQPQHAKCAYCGLWGTDYRCDGCGAPRDFAAGQRRFTLE